MIYRIEKAVPEDAETIAGFQEALVHETDHLKPDIERMRRGVRRVFDDPSIGTYLVARTVEGSPIGCLLLQREWSDWRDAFVWWIHSVYVAPEYRQRGVLRNMIIQAEELARESGAAGLRLYVEVDNVIAQAAYRKVGLASSYYDFMEKMF